MALGELWGYLTAATLGIGLAACAGLRAWLPLLVAGVLGRLGWVEIGESFRFLSSWPALILFGVATVAEIAADKVPAVDHALDAISTVIRPLAGALLAASAIYQIKDPLIAVAIGVIVGAPVSLAPHAAKSALRAASSATTAGLANPFVSLLEDALTLFLLFLVFVLPLISLAIVAMFVWLLFRYRARRQRTVPAPTYAG